MEESTPTKEQRTKRHTENTRRYRARRQEYVADLERRLAESRQQDNLAMKEVQLAAQRVAHENAQLKALLQLRGVENHVVKSWLSGPKVSLPGVCTPTSRKVDSSRCSSQEMISRSTQTQSELEAAIVQPTRQYAVSALLTGPTTPAPRDLDDDRESQIVSTERTTYQRNETPSYKCKNISHLLAQPDADLRDSSARPEDNRIVGDGIECSVAFSMAMPFATSDEKADAIAQKLKDGCVLNKDGRGCKVKASAMWEALDKAMNET